MAKVKSELNGVPMVVGLTGKGHLFVVYPFEWTILNEFI